MLTPHLIIFKMHLVHLWEFPKCSQFQHYSRVLTSKSPPRLQAISELWAPVKWNTGYIIPRYKGAKGSVSFQGEGMRKEQRGLKGSKTFEHRSIAWIAHVSINKWQFCWANSLPPLIMYAQVIKFGLPGLCGKYLYVMCFLSDRPLLFNFFLMSFWSYLPELSVLFMIFYDFSNVCLHTFPNLCKLLTIPKDHMVRFDHSNSPIAGIYFLYGYLTIQNEDPMALDLEAQWDFLLLSLPCLLA